MLFFWTLIDSLYTLLKIKVLHNAIEEPLTSQKVLCGERRFLRLYKGKKEMVL